MTRKICVIGAGAAGGSICLALKQAGQTICGVYDEDPVRAGLWAQKLELPPDRVTFGAVSRAQTILVAVPEDAIESVARRAVREGVCRDDQVWLHTAGSRPGDLLAPVRPLVAGVGVFHPPYAFASGVETRVPSGLVFSAGGDPLARKRAAELAEVLDGTTTDIDDSDRTKFHCACVFAANYVTTLLDQACGLFESIGVEGDVARRMAAQLAESAAGQLRQRPAPEALSGPIRRGDAKTVQEHLRALADRWDTQLLYRQLGQLTVDLVELAKPSLPAERVRKLRKVLRNEE